MRATDFLFEKESLADEILSSLSGLGFQNIRKDSNKTVSVFVPGHTRQQTIKDIVANLSGSVYDPNMAGSSLGGIKFAGGKIKIKPLKGQGYESAGLDNEQHLIDTINKFINQKGPIKLTFVGDNGKNVSVDGVTQAVGTGKDTKGRKKSDVNIISDSKILPISIKKSNAEYWESADTLYGNRADSILDILVANQEVTITPIGKKTPDGREKVSIKPEVAIKASPEETLDVVFGSDILQEGGAVIKDTFTDEHYTLKGNHLFVTADLVIKEPEDIPENLQVYFLIRNDSSRNRPGSKYPGIRVLGSYASRVKNAKKVDPSILSSTVPAQPEVSPEQEPDKEMPKVPGKITSIAPATTVQTPPDEYSKKDELERVRKNAGITVEKSQSK